MVEQFSLCIIVSDNTHSKQHHPSGSFVVGEFFLQTLLILYSKKKCTHHFGLFPVGGRKYYLLTMLLK